MEDEIITSLNMSVQAKGTWNIERKGSVSYGMLADISLNLSLSQWMTEFGPFLELRSGRDRANGLKTLPVK